MKDIQLTSLEAFNEIKKDLGKRQLEIYLCLRKIEPANNLMISKKSGIPLQSVCGRINELRNKLKLVGYVYTAKCPFTGRSSMFWRCVR